MLFNELMFPVTMVPGDPYLLALAHDGFDGAENVTVEANRVPFVAATFLVQRLVPIVVRHFRVVALVPTEDETIRANVAHEGEHRQERWPVVFREMQIVRHDPALYFELRHWSRLWQESCGEMEEQ
jgi:hypothetical protein